MNSLSTSQVQTLSKNIHRAQSFMTSLSTDAMSLLLGEPIKRIMPPQFIISTNVVDMMMDVELTNGKCKSVLAIYEDGEWLVEPMIN